jgi:hypothetical protein
MECIKSQRATMKKVLLTIYLVFSLSISSINADEKDESIIEYFSNGVASGIFRTAWPTATYSDFEYMGKERIAGGYQVQLKFKGNSNMCFVGTCPLWFKLGIDLDFEYNIKDMSVLKHNAIMQPPFKTSGAIAQAIAEANSN